MDEDVQRLVLVPFQELVQKGKESLENAKVAGLAVMQASAEKLIKEGERALKKLEPLCKKQLDEYGANFAAALKEHDEIANFRTELNDALWEFDDYTVADDFDAEKFAELQQLSRKAAPKIYDILMRMKLEHPEPEPEPSISGFSASSSIPAAALLAGGLRHTPEVALAALATADNASGYPTAQSPTQAVNHMLEGFDSPLAISNQAAPGREHAVQPLRVPSRRTPEPAIPEPRRADSVRQEEIPPKPPVSPWETKIHTFIPPQFQNTTLDAEVVPPELPVTIWMEGLDSPLPPPADNRAPANSRFGASSVDDGVDRMYREIEADVQPNPPARGSMPGAGPVLPYDSPTLGRGSFAQMSRPAQPRSSTGSLAAGPAAATLPQEIPPLNRRDGSPLVGSPTSASHRNSQASSLNDSHSSGVDLRVRDSIVSPVSDHRMFGTPAAERTPVEPVRDSLYSVAEHPVMASWSSPVKYASPYDPAFATNVTPDSHKEVLNHTSYPTPIQIDDGLIPVVDSPERAAAPHQIEPMVQADCTIGLNSSFFQFKGFCEGAKEVVRGGLGVKKIKKAGFGAGAAVAAKCKNCLYELDWASVEADLNGGESASYQTCGVGFRLRFLSKSHLTARHVEDQSYACLFCVQLGKTSEDSDATVFFSQRQLFAHLSRHARPLPTVPGVTVIESATIPQGSKNNYDLHFPNPPAKSLMAGLSREIYAMPTAIATETFRSSNGALRAPPGATREPVLQFAVGARIVGVQFPARFHGEWGIGWADNMRAAFPVDCVRIEPPPKTQVRMEQSSSMRAVARWSRKPKDKNKELGDWLRFEKGEIITGIGYPYPEHWCWSGYNAKGRWGIFPQSFMEPNTLMEAPGSDRASIISHESKMGVFSRLGTKKNRQTNAAAASSDIVHRPKVTIV